MTENDSSDSRDSLMTVELDPTENDTINTIHQPDIYKSRIFATMKIKGGEHNQISNRYRGNLQCPKKE